MAKHTPGPWDMHTAPTQIGSCHKIGPFPSGRSVGGSHACIYADGIRIGVDDQIPMAVELRANARLISAAPDLLTALALARTILCDLEGYEPSGASILVIDAAIAKATGEAP